MVKCRLPVILYIYRSHLGLYQNKGIIQFTFDRIFPVKKTKTKTKKQKTKTKTNKKNKKTKTKRIVKKNGFVVISETELRAYPSTPFSLSLQEFMTSKPAKLNCNILFLRKNGKYIIDVHCSSDRIRIFDEMTLHQKPLFKIFSWRAFAPISVSTVPISRHTALAGTLILEYFLCFMASLSFTGLLVRSFHSHESVWVSNISSQVIKFAVLYLASFEPFYVSTDDRMEATDLVW